jgi:transposase-like protein
MLNSIIFQDEEAAYRFVEERVWPDGPVCPHCKSARRTGKLAGSSTRIGTYKCYECRKPFTVKIGTIFEASHVPLHIWLRALHLMCSTDGSPPSGRIADALGVTRKTASFIMDRIRQGTPVEYACSHVSLIQRREGGSRHAPTA